MHKVEKRKSLHTGQISCLLSFVTAPFLTISAALQLSVMPHLKIYGDFQPGKEPSLRGLLRGASSSKAVARAPSEVMKQSEKQA